MDFNLKNLKRFIIRYKVPIIVSSIGLSMAMMAIIAGAFYLSMQAVSVAKTKVLALKTNVTEEINVEGMSLGSLIPADSITQFVTGIAGQVMRQSVDSGNSNLIIAGLNCIDSIGGPSPSVVLNELKPKISDPNIIEMIDEINSGQVKSTLPSEGQGHCQHWIKGLWTFADWQKFSSQIGA